MDSVEHCMVPRAVLVTKTVTLPFRVILKIKRHLRARHPAQGRYLEAFVHPARFPFLCSSKAAPSTSSSWRLYNLLFLVDVQKEKLPALVTH